MSLLPEGRHEVEILATGLKKAGTGTLQIYVEFGNEDGTINAYLPISESAWQYTEAKLQTMGWDPEEHGFNFEELADEQCPIIGNQVQIVVQEEEWQGKVRPKVSFINPAGSSGAAGTASGEEVGTIADEIRGLLGIKRLGSGKRKAKDAGGDDVGF